MQGEDREPGKKRAQEDGRSTKLESKNTLNTPARRAWSLPTLPGDGRGETGRGGGGRTFLSRDKRKSHNCFVLCSGAGGRLYLPEGLRSLWQPHIWAPESRCAVSRSHSRMMRQT